MVYPSKQEFLSLAKRGNLIPVYREISADLETPVSSYLKISKNTKYSFLLESVEGGEKIARYSFLATDPELIFRSKGQSAEITRLNRGVLKKNKIKITDTPFSFLREIMSQYKFVDIKGLPRFCGGLVGYIGYDAVRFIEDLPTKTRDDLKLPDIVLILAKTLVIFDHVAHKIKIVSCASIDPKAGKKQILSSYAKSIQDINLLIGKLNHPLEPLPRAPESLRQKINVQSNFTEAQFKKLVLEAKKEIRRGEIIQVVPSQRFHVKLKTDPLTVYRALRSINPSPYMYYLHFDEIDIVGSSPELLVRCENGIVETRPIAGTRPRGQDEKEDQSLAKELLSDPKERAEHIMLVDLGRNDLGRVCRIGTVKVTDLMSIERYSHVMHIVTNVRGELKEKKDMFDVLSAAFPAGTVTGAPKIRAMEIIENLEKVTRGPYAGCIGYFDFSGNMDTCITIRTIIIKENNAYVQAGGGIVADSNPKKEYMETVNKAKAQIKAIELAQGGIR